MSGQAKNTSPGLSRQNSSFSNLMALNLDRYGEDWAGALTLLDVIETFFDSRLDLFNRRLRAQSNRLKSRAVEMLPKQLRTPKGGGILLLDDEGQDEGKGTERNKSRGERYKEDVEREVERIKIKLAAKVTHLSGTWKSEQVVRTKDKVSFLFGVLSLAFTCLLYGMAPEWFPVAYTVQAAFYMPIRIYTYHRKAWHYFLFDLCYFVNGLDLLWIWVFPSSTFLFICCYLLTLGPLASAIITWRNSLVFHSLDKVTSIFIHIYPPIVLTVIRHVIPNAEEKYSGLKHLGEYKWYTMILLSSVPYILWQGAYYKFISVDRKSKIESGERQNSFRYLLNDKRGPIGKALQGIRSEHRELWFIFGQLIYSIIFMIPPSTLYIHSSTASSTFLIIIFTVSAWNGATFYVEVFGRKFERELEKLRKEMEVISATMTPSTSAAGTSPAVGDAPISSPLSSAEQMNDAEDDLNDSPLVLPDAQGTEASKEAQIPDLILGKAIKEIDNEPEDQGIIRQRKKA
ncbi:Integral to membrane protein, putative [Cryptococcus gattii WM276]|uniref:Glycerophosphocholine acyltransferase 1 n=2 Tax=Cryptococcus gattii TaxID=37769 RepID=E6QZ53_CRYGW|nr:Integral to membrane protein, putative [Cryptococcus gattii WM276]ADV19386.1 Integral to membrane protein, putative [Cryptococcus gattii WM276]KIR79961.1 integral membrane protein [Cryptococcus gattii EJB2]